MVNLKVFVGLVLFLFSSNLLISQRQSDSLSTSRKAVVDVMAYDKAGNLINKGAGVVIDSSGNAITMYPVISKADIIKVKTYDGKVEEISTLNGLDYEGGIVRFKLRNKPNVFLTQNEQLVIKNSLIYIYDGSEKPKEGKVKVKNNLRHYGNTMKINIPELEKGNTGNAILTAEGKIIGIIIQDNDDPSNVVAIDAHRIKEINPYEIEKFNEAYFKGVIAMSKEQYKKAYMHFNKSLEKNPYNSKALTRRGEIKIKYEDYISAIDDFNKVLMIDLDDDYAFYSIGLAYFNLNNYNIANDWFSNAIKYNEKNKFAFKMRAESRFLLGSYNAAIADLDKALILDENYGDAYYMRGVCKASNNKSKRSACNDLKKAFNLGVDGAEETMQRYCK